MPFMTPAKAWLGKYRTTSSPSPSTGGSKSADETTTKRTIDMAPTTAAEAWLGEFVVPASSSPKAPTSPADGANNASSKGEHNAKKPAVPEVAHLLPDQHSKKSARPVKTMDGFGTNFEMDSVDFGFF